MISQHSIIVLLALVALILSIVLVAHKSKKSPAKPKTESFDYTKQDMSHLCQLQKQMFKQYPFINSPSNVEQAYQNCQKYWSPSMNMPSAFVKQQRF